MSHGAAGKRGGRRSARIGHEDETRAFFCYVTQDRVGRAGVIEQDNRTETASPGSGKIPVGFGPTREDGQDRGSGLAGLERPGVEGRAKALWCGVDDDDEPFEGARGELGAALAHSEDGAGWSGEERAGCGPHSGGILTGGAVQAEDQQRGEPLLDPLAQGRRGFAGTHKRGGALKAGCAEFAADLTQSALGGIVSGGKGARSQFSGSGEVEYVDRVQRRGAAAGDGFG